MTSDRMRRVNEAVREVLSAAITTELKDPRVGFVTVTAVETSPIFAMRAFSCRCSATPGNAAAR